MRKAFKLAILGTIAMTIVNATLAVNEKANQAQQAYEILDEQFGSKDGGQVTCSASNALMVLVDSSFGVKHLRELANRHDAITYDEERNAVYYVHSQRSTDKSCLGTAFLNSDEGRLSGHSGFYSQVSLNAVDIADEVPSVECEISAAEEDRKAAERMGYEPGERVTLDIALAEIREKNVRPDDLGLSVSHR